MAADLGRVSDSWSSAHWAWAQARASAVARPRVSAKRRAPGCRARGPSDAASRCQAHHVKPWESRARGETNVDEMCLLCADCHHQLHHKRQTLEWDAAIKRWLARPALPHEKISGGS